MILALGIGFLRPELLLAALPVGWLLWRSSPGQHGLTVALRAAAAAALVLAIAGAYLRAGSSARHVVFVVDRSASMPKGSETEASELIDLSLAARQGQDQVHVVTFAEGATLERSLDRTARGFGGFERSLAADGSDLASALELALSLIPETARGSIVVLSDGEVENETAVDAAVQSASARAVRIDVRELGRTRTADTAVERVEIPGEVDVAEPFFITAWIRSDESQVRAVALLRDGEVVARRELELAPGRTRVRFRDRKDSAGTSRYTVELQPIEGADGALDRTPENDRALAATRAVGAKPVLVVNHDGAVDTLTAALRGAGLPAVPITPESLPKSILGLDSFRAVILENVSAARLGLDRMETLRTWTLDHGGGLLVTGGLASFGSGGYFRSPLDELLPVSMELRQEHRKLAVALSVTLDRSGSMGAQVAGGTKMDLANRGTVEALRLLTPNDSASVIAVDSSPHVVQPQENLTDMEGVVGRVLGIQSGGGGIFTAVALEASALQLEKAAQATRHVILFADAADAEQYDETPEAIQLLRSLGATLSVIALGSDTDQDAAFLKRCARDGGGEIYFTTSATDLPRLFAMDTQAVARSTFVDEPTPVEARPELFGLGEIAAADFPVLEGYNLTYLRPGASLGAVTTDEYAAPVFAFQPKGLGRVAAFTAQLGGTHGSSLEAWDGYASFFVTAVRWLSGVEAPAGVFASIVRDGRDAVMRIELDPDFDGAPLGETLTATVGTEDGASTEVTLQRVDATRFEARHALKHGQVALGTVSVAGPSGAQAVPMPPIALPYSPEYERPTDLRAGQRLLRRAASRSGGVTQLAATDVFRGERGAQRWQSIARRLALLGLLLMLVEIAGRRLSLWEGAGGWFRQLASRGLRRARRALRLRREISEDAGAKPRPASLSPSPSPDSGSGSGSGTVAAQPSAAPAAEVDLGDALSRARRAARGRLRR